MLRCPSVCQRSCPPAATAVLLCGRVVRYRSDSGPLNSSGVFKCKFVPETSQDVDNSRACLAADKHTRRYPFIL